MAVPGIKIEGDAELIRMLNGLGDKVYKKHLRRIMRSEGAVIVKVAKANLKVMLATSEDSTGLLVRSLGAQVTVLGISKVKTDRGYRHRGSMTGMTVAIGPRRGMGRLVLDPKAKKQSDRLLGAKQSSLVYKATTQKQRKQWGMVFRNPSRYAHLVEKGIAGKGRASTGAKPFIRKTYMSQRSSSINKVKRELWRAIKTEAIRSR